jgi:hypothetical protein
MECYINDTRIFKNVSFFSFFGKLRFFLGSTTFFEFERFLDFLLFDLLDGFLFGFLICAMVLHTVIWIRFQTTFS